MDRASDTGASTDIDRKVEAGSEKDLAASAFVTAYTRMSADLSSFFWNAFMLLGLNGVSGDYVEFGSEGANSLCLAYDVIRQTPATRHIWAFDSFAGLPDSTGPRDEHPALLHGVPRRGVQAFHAACEARGVPRDAYTTIEGFYDATLPPLGTTGAPTDIALVYVDCNLYSSTVTVFDFLAPRLKHGMIVAFDDYYLYSPSHVSGEREALREFLVQHPQWNFQRYKDLHHMGVSFIVEHAESHSSDGERAMKITVPGDDGTPIDFECADNWVSNWVSKGILSGKTYAYLPFVDDVLTVFDVGANCGATTVHFARHYPYAEIHSFEPGRGSFEILQRNASSYRNVHPHNIGLHSVDQEVPLYLGDGDAGFASIIQRSSNLGTSELVKLRAAGAWARENGIDRIDVLKVDVEGCELDVLESLGDLLPAVKICYIEYDSRVFRRSIASLLEPTHELYSGVVFLDQGEIIYLRRDYADLEAAPDYLRTLFHAGTAGGAGAS